MAARKVMIDVIVDDKGTTKRVAVNAKDLGMQLDKTSKKSQSSGNAFRDMGANAASADRALKGASQQSSSTTKNFSKMSQGIGGVLVPAYATLAASVFALSAAFRFLEDAANIQNQIAGMEAFAETTGSAMRSITQSVRSATGSLVGFREASQAVAIATAAGFNKDQIVDLAEGSKLAAIALGRDATDSFNRLIRGVTKAEPELLDELGIVLRLEDATRAYANELGKAATKLTTAERKTAVFNEVNRQLQSNFQAIENEANNLINPVTKLAKSFEDIIIEVQKLILGPLTTLFSFLSRNSEAVVVLFAGFAASIAKQALPGLTNLNQGLDEWAAKLEVVALKQKSASLGAVRQAEITKKAFLSGNRELLQARQALLGRLSIDQKKFNNLTIAQQKKTIAKLIAEEKLRSEGVRATYLQDLRTFQATYTEMEVIQAGALTRMGARWRAFSAGVSASLASTKASVSAFTTDVAKAAASAAGILQGIGRLFSGAFLLFIVYEVIDFMFDLIFVTDELRASVEKVNDTYKNLKAEVEDISRITTGYFTTFKEQLEQIEDPAERINRQFEFLANALANIKSSDAIGSLVEDLQSVEISREWFGLFGEDTVDPALSSLSATITSALIGVIPISDLQKDSKLFSDSLDAVLETLTNVGMAAEEGRVGISGLGSVLDEATVAFRNFQGITLEKELENLENQVRSTFREYEQATSKGAKAAKALAAETAIENFVYKVQKGLIEESTEGRIQLTKATIELLSAIGKSNDVLLKFSQNFRGLTQSISSFQDLISRAITKPTELGQAVAGLDNILLDFNGTLDDLAKIGITESPAIIQLLASRGIAEEFINKIKGKGVELLKGESGISSEILEKLQSQEEVKSALNKIENQQTLSIKEQNILIRAGLELAKQELHLAELREIQREAEIQSIQRLKTLMLQINTIARQEAADRFDILLKDREIEAVAQKIKVQELFITIESGRQKTLAEERLKVLEAQKTNLEAQKLVMEKMLQVGFQLRKAFIETFDRELASGFAQLIKNEESSIKDVFLNAIKGALESMADVIARQLTKPFTDFVERSIRRIFGIPEEESIEAINKQLKDVLVDTNMSLLEVDDSLIRLSQALELQTQQLALTETPGAVTGRGRQQFDITNPEEQKELLNYLRTVEAAQLNAESILREGLSEKDLTQGATAEAAKKLLEKEASRTENIRKIIADVQVSIDKTNELLKKNPDINVIVDMEQVGGSIPTFSVESKPKSIDSELDPSTLFEDYTRRVEAKLNEYKDIPSWLERITNVLESIWTWIKDFFNVEDDRTTPTTETRTFENLQKGLEEQQEAWRKGLENLSVEYPNIDSSDSGVIAPLIKSFPTTDELYDMLTGVVEDIGEAIFNNVAIPDTNNKTNIAPTEKSNLDTDTDLEDAGASIQQFRHGVDTSVASIQASTEQVNAFTRAVSGFEAPRLEQDNLEFSSLRTVNLVANEVSLTSVGRKFPEQTDREVSESYRETSPIQFSESAIIDFAQEEQVVNLLRYVTNQIEAQKRRLEVAERTIPFTGEQRGQQLNAIKASIRELTRFAEIVRENADRVQAFGQAGIDMPTTEFGIVQGTESMVPKVTAIDPEADTSGIPKALNENGIVLQGIEDKTQKLLDKFNVLSNKEILLKLEINTGRTAGQLGEILLLMKQFISKPMDQDPEGRFKRTPAMLTTTSDGVPDKTPRAVEEAATQVKEVELNSESYERTTKESFQEGAQWLNTFSKVPGEIGQVAGEFSRALNTLMSGDANSIGGFIANLWPFETGGIAPGGFRAFANGGTITRPTLGLVGEGRMNEAVVPLPDGRSIPVQMQNGGGDTNNVNLSLTFNENGDVEARDAQAESERMAQFGNVVVGVVQREIANQKRPGGLLYRG